MLQDLIANTAPSWHRIGKPSILSSIRKSQNQGLAAIDDSGEHMYIQTKPEIGKAPDLTQFLYLDAESDAEYDYGSYTSYTALKRGSLSEKQPRIIRRKRQSKILVSDDEDNDGWKGLPQFHYFNLPNYVIQTKLRGLTCNYHQERPPCVIFVDTARNWSLPMAKVWYSLKFSLPT